MRRCFESIQVDDDTRPVRRPNNPSLPEPIVTKEDAIPVSAWQVAQAEIQRESGAATKVEEPKEEEEEIQDLGPVLSPEEIWRRKLEGLQNTFNLQLTIVARGCNTPPKILLLDVFQLSVNTLLSTTAELIQMLPQTRHVNKVQSQLQYTLSQMKGNATLLCSYIEQVQKKYHEGMYIASQEQVDNAMTKKLAEKVLVTLKELIGLFKNALSADADILLEKKLKMAEEEEEETAKENYNGQAVEDSTEKRGSASPKITPRANDEALDTHTSEGESIPESTKINQDDETRITEKADVGELAAISPLTSPTNPRYVIEPRRAPDEGPAGFKEFRFLAGLATCVPETRLLVSELEKPLAESDPLDFGQAKVAISRAYSNDYSFLSFPYD